MLRKAIPALLLVWCALSLAVEMGTALEGWDLQEASARRPAAWRFGTPQLDRLAACLDDVRARVPRGSVIAFASPAGQDVAGERNAFFRTLWAAYLLPEHDVLQIDDPSAPQLAEYAVDFRVGLDLPRLELLAQLRGCRLFKVR
ncbi:MAG TPA: hypothetical protein VEW48_04170 [Thermoanaerobaculia bacterium]|nr:hypothetical protein [Thermoanaerobaculia bacterium]